MTVFIFFCIGAGLVLAGVFISKALSPVEAVTTTTNSVQTKFNGSAVFKSSSNYLNHSENSKCSVLDATHNYNVCLESLKPFQNFCQQSCRYNNINCESACFDKYGANLKTCQVKK